MNKFIYFITFALATLLTACCDDLPAVNNGSDTTVPDGTPIEISSAIEIPEMNFGSGHNSRILQDNIDSEYLKNTLKIHLFVFDKSGAMRQFIEPKDISIDTTKTNATTAYFRVKNIYASTEPRIFHFVILPDITDLRTIKGGEYIDMMANEQVVMPALQIGNQTDAYWGREEVNTIEANKTVMLKAVRNFAKVNVSTNIDPNDETYGKFKITAYAIVNKPAHSLIAPYITKNHLFAKFYDDEGLNSYEEVQDQGFNGINPSDANDALFCNTAEEVKGEIQASRGKIEGNKDVIYPATLGNSHYYIYEHQQSGLAQAASSAKVTYLIIQAERNNKTYYYKVDIGHEDQGKFYYYDIIRNFQYTVQIDAVTGNGATSIEEAMQGAAVNNLTASIVTRDLFSIGYEKDKIEVSNTRAFITSPNATHTFQFRYTIDGGTVDPSLFKIYDLNNENDDTKHYNMGSDLNKDLEYLHSAEVIKKASIKPIDGGWYELTYTTGALPTSGSERYEQTLKVLYEDGSYLSRTFTIMLRQPWEFGVNTTNTSIGIGYNEDISIQFTMPEGLSKTQFPIVVTFESDKQNIYAVPGEDLTVNYVKSGFDGATTDNVISYERRIEYEEYAGKKTYTVNFKTNTEAEADKAYNTSGIDDKKIDGRTNNNGTPNFCIRMGDRNPDGMKYFKPYYINYTRQDNNNN